MAVYKKTSTGMTESLAVHPSIDARLFSVLALVDGLREDDDIKQLSREAGLPADGLDILIFGGFIEKKFKGSVTPPPAAVSSETSVQRPERTDKTIKFKGFQNLYAHLVKETKTLLGLKGFIFQLRIERASSLDELEALIGPLSETIAKKHGLEIAQNFKRESDLLVRVAVFELQSIVR